MKYNKRVKGNVSQARIRPYPMQQYHTQQVLVLICPTVSVPPCVVPDLLLPGLTVSQPHCDPRLMHSRLLSGPTV